MEDIKKNLAVIRNRIAEAATRAGRNPQEIKLIAVSKKMSREKIQAAADCGQIYFGENYLQEAKEKIVHLPPALSWHFIGHLQVNKAKTVAELFQMVETVDSLKLATVLDRHAARLGRTLAILVEVKIGGEQQKSGVLPHEAAELLGTLERLRNLRIDGLMAMPPFSADPEETRPYFRKLRRLSQELAQKKLLGRQGRFELSMGMSNDFEVAIEEGATIVRVGSAIFGART
jgi:hypothetical protein